jgi:hypothetical protein
MLFRPGFWVEFYDYLVYKECVPYQEGLIMTDLSAEDYDLLERAVAAHAAAVNNWPVSLGWQPRWIGTGIESTHPGNRWQCQGLRTVIFTHLDDSSGPEQGSRWTLPYTQESGFGSSIDRNAPPVTELFDNIVSVFP